MRWLACTIVLLAARVVLGDASESPRAPQTNSGIFAIGFTNISDSAAKLVFTTTVPEAAAVRVTDPAGKSVFEISESKLDQIHRVDISGLTAGDAYDVSIAADSGAEHASFKAGLRRPNYERFDHRILFGVAHADDFDSLIKLGAGAVRVSYTWDGLQPRPGPFDQSAVARMVDAVTRIKSAGIEPIVLLCFSTTWEKKYTRAQLHWRHPAFGPPDNLDDWKAYVHCVMAALKGKARYYEIWNEPDAGYLASGTAIERAAATMESANRSVWEHNDEYWIGDRYVPLVIAARDVADEVDPAIQLMGPSWNHDYSGTRGRICFQRGIAPYLAEYSIHNYVGAPHSYASWELWTNQKYFASAEKLFEQFNAPLPIAVTEWGIQSYDAPPPNAGFASRADAQAFLIKSAFDYLQLQRTPIVILHQLGFNDAWALTDKADNGDIIEHPAFQTYQWICHTFNDKRYACIPVSISGGGPNDRAYAIQRVDDGDVYIAAWRNITADAPPPTASKPASMTVRIDPGWKGDVTVQQLGLDGQAIATQKLHQTHGIELSYEPATAAGTEPPPDVWRLSPINP